MFDLKVNSQTYKFLLAHGSGYSQKSDYQIHKAMDIYTDREIIMIGHNHRIYSEAYTKIEAKGGREVERIIYGVRTGAFLKYPDYAREKLYAPSKTGSPVIMLYSDDHIISVNTSGFPETWRGRKSR